MKTKDIKNNDFVTLTLTEEQARVVSTACEFFSRIKMGQFSEIIWNMLDITEDSENFFSRRDAAEEFLLKARKEIYPELHGFGHSYGIGKFKDADLAFDVHQVLRRLWGDPREPFSYHQLPKAEKVIEKLIKE